MFSKCQKIDKNNEKFKNFIQSGLQASDNLSTKMEPAQNETHW